MQHLRSSTSRPDDHIHLLGDYTVKRHKDCTVPEPRVKVNRQKSQQRRHGDVWGSGKREIVMYIMLESSLRGDQISVALRGGYRTVLECSERSVSVL